MNQSLKLDSAAPLTEQVSALIDGELDRAETEATIGRLCGDPALLRQWHELHRVGDALRSNEVAACDVFQFCTRLSAAIADEPTVLAPRSASSTGLRRFLAPGLAVAASVAVVGFIAVPLLRSPETASIAQVIAPALEASPVDLVAQKALPTIVNARGAGPSGLSPSFNPYLAAHRELIGNSVVPRAAVYLRSSEDR